MMSKYAIEFYPNVSQLMALMSDPTTGPMVSLAQAASANSSGYDTRRGGAPYRVANSLMSEINSNPNIDMDLLIDKCFTLGVRMVFPSGIWIEVPTTSIDNLVPVDWPEAKASDDIDPDTGDIITAGARRQFQEITGVQPGINGTSLLRCGIRSPGAAFVNTEVDGVIVYAVDSPAMIKLYQDKFPDSQLVYSDKRVAWLAANTDQFLV
jgi:hypothetical protein